MVLKSSLAARHLRSPMGASQSRRSVQTMASADKVQMIRSTIASDKVVIFSKTYCPYCVRVKQLFQELKVDAQVLELDKMSDGAAIQSALQSETGCRTVPQVFIAEKFIGGCDDTYAAHRSGKLVPLLTTAGVSVSA